MQQNHFIKPRELKMTHVKKSILHDCKFMIVWNQRQESKFLKRKVLWEKVNGFSNRVCLIVYAAGSQAEIVEPVVIPLITFFFTVRPLSKGFCLKTFCPLHIWTWSLRFFVSTPGSSVGLYAKDFITARYDAIAVTFDRAIQLIRELFSMSIVTLCGPASAS